MRKIVFSAVLALVFGAMGCQDKKQAKATEVGASETLSIKHELGLTEVVKNPKRVVILNYGVLDSFDQLGLEVGATAKGNLPSYLKKYGQDPSVVDVGSIKEPNFEKINELNPELIIIAARQASLFEELSKIAPTVYMDVDKDNYLASFQAMTRQIGQIFGKEAPVEAALEKFDAQIETIKAQASQSDKKALIVLTNEGRMSTYGKGSRFGIVHDVFGLAPADEKIEASTHGQSISNEFIKEVNPDILFVIDRGAAIKRSDLQAGKEQFANVLIQDTQAYKNDKIVFLDPEVWYLSGGGLKSVQLMIDEVAQALD